MKTLSSRIIVIVTAAAACVLWCIAAVGQQPGSISREDAVLKADGVVREVFRSQRPDRIDYLVEIEVKRTQADRVPRSPVRVAMPAPGDLIYVYVSQRSVGGQQDGRFAGQTPPSSGPRPVVPAERSEVRAYLVPGTRGGWTGAGDSWFETTSDVLAEANPADGPATAPETPSVTRTETSPVGGKLAVAALGFTGESMNVKGQLVVRVLSVEQGGPAQRSGLEPGDIVIGANDAALGGLERLSQLARQGTLKNLLVLDVNTGKSVRVAIDLAAAGTSGSRPTIEPPSTGNNPTSPPAANRNTTATGASRSLGISAEPVMVGKRTGMKVTRVEPGSPAQVAGIEVGDVIVAANGVAVTGVEVLSAVLKKSGSGLTLTVRDTRSGKDVPVTVKLGGPEASAPLPVPTDTPIQTGAGRKLGAVTELVFYDVNPAVKVTEVEPDSPAARAGLQPGDIITEANGTPVLHPKTLDELVRKSAATLKLQVVDPSSNKKTTVDVNLNGR